jgi:hypothetical protein
MKRELPLLRLGNFAMGEGVYTRYLLGEENP